MPPSCCSSSGIRTCVGCSRTDSTDNRETVGAGQAAAAFTRGTNRASKRSPNLNVIANIVSPFQSMPDELYRTVGRSGSPWSFLEDLRHTGYPYCMTMLSFRLDDQEAVQAQQWADRLGVDRSELMRQALHRHLVRLASEDDAVRWQEQPLDDGERSLAAIADWGPAEDWSDWADAAR